MTVEAALRTDDLRKLLSYDPETGGLMWLRRPMGMFAREQDFAPWNAKFAYKAAFTAVQSSGYKHGSIFGRLFLAHRVAWALATGFWPALQIDHINGVRSDNRFCNLRLATQSQNLRNRGVQSDNVSGIKGVGWIPDAQVYRARIMVHGKQHHLGRFKTAAEAATAYAVAVEIHHGEFGRTDDLALAEIGHHQPRQRSAPEALQLGPRDPKQGSCEL